MQNEEVTQLIKAFLRAMQVGFDDVVVSAPDVAGCPIFSIKTKESGTLIGTQGAHLGALNHLIKKMVSKTLKEGEDVKLIVDVNDYHDRLLRDLKARALMMADRARSFGIDVSLPPMSPYERMLVHSILEGAPDIKTESEGVGKDRKVVIKYIQPLV